MLIRNIFVHSGSLQLLENEFQINSLQLLKYEFQISKKEYHRDDRETKMQDAYNNN